MLLQPQFPPLLTGHAVSASKEPFDEACRRAQARRLGAGDIVWSRSEARAELAVILEPDVPLARTVQMGPLMMVALGDSLGALAPPKLALQYRWPSSVLLNGSSAGDVRLAVSRTSHGDVPAWLVVGARLQISEERKDAAWAQTSLADEVGPQISRTDVLQSLAAHFLTRLNAWQDEGFRAVRDAWLFRAEGRGTPVSIQSDQRTIEAQVVGMNDNADLVIETASGVRQTLSYLQHVSMLAEVGSA